MTENVVHPHVLIGLFPPVPMKISHLDRLQLNPHPPLFPLSRACSISTGCMSPLSEDLMPVVHSAEMNIAILLRCIEEYLSYLHLVLPASMGGREATTKLARY